MTYIACPADMITLSKTHQEVEGNINFDYEFVFAEYNPKSTAMCLHIFKNTDRMKITCLLLR